MLKGYPDPQVRVRMELARARRAQEANRARVMGVFSQDTELVHVNPQELAMLRRYAGHSGVLNPVSGLRGFGFGTGVGAMDQGGIGGPGGPGASGPSGAGDQRSIRDIRAATGPFGSGYAQTAAPVSRAISRAKQRAIASMHNLTTAMHVMGFTPEEMQEGYGNIAATLARALQEALSNTAARISGPMAFEIAASFVQDYSGYSYDLTEESGSPGRGLLPIGILGRR